MSCTITRTWFAVLAVLTLLFVAGCSGGSDGIPLTVDSSLVGTWQPYTASVDGTVVPIADEFGWGDHGDDGVVNWEEITFNADGTFTQKRYESATEYTTESGTFTATEGNGQLVPQGETEDGEGAFTYAFDGNILVVTFTNDEGTVVTRWVKQSGITSTDSELLGFWTPTAITVDGQVVSVADYFHFANISANTDAAVFQFLANGAFTMRYLQLDGPLVGGKVENPTNLETAFWNTKDTRLKFTLPDQASCYGVYTTTATTFEMEFLDLSRTPACTVKILFTRWGSEGNHPAALQGRWLAETATIGGTPTALEDFFNWQNGEDNMLLEFYADGTMESRNRTGATIVSRQLGKWHSPDTGEITIIMDNEKDGTYSIDGNTLTVTILEGTDTAVLTFTKQP